MSSGIFVGNEFVARISGGVGWAEVEGSDSLQPRCGPDAASLPVIAKANSE